MSIVTIPLPDFLQGVTRIARSVAHGHHRSTHSRRGGSLGTGNTVLVARSAQRGHGKHRLVRAA